MSTWRGLPELMEQLGQLSDSFMAFATAQEATWPEDGIEPISKWLAHRWGQIFYPHNEHPGCREVVVYERTGHYCGAFKYDPETKTWTDLESGFTHPDPEGDDHARA